MDDVIADTYGKHIEIYNEEFNANLSKDTIHSGEVWQNAPIEHKQNILSHAYRDGFFIDLSPMDDSIEVMKALYEKHEVYIASAAMQFPNSLREKSDWLAKYFPFIHWSHQILCGDKSILNGDLLIDDRSYNLKRFEGDTLLFSSPHNQHETEYDRMNSWKEIAARLL
jgi:5'(3')-deoxyribonucleotidase